MYISYDYYRVFYYVAKYGSISQSAKLLLNDQPNLSRAIKNLENELGCVLFVRTHRGMTLTKEGEKLFAHIRIAFEHIEAGEKEITQINKLQSGSVSVAVSEVALHCFLLPILKEYRTRYPGIRVRIGNHTTPQAIAALNDGFAEIAVVTTPAENSPALVKTELKDIHTVAVCGSAYSSLLSRRIPLKELLEYPQISLGPQTKSFELYSSFFAAHNLHYSPDIEAATADQILPMVASDLGIGFIPKEFLTDAPNVHILELEEEIPLRSICMIRLKKQPLGAAAKELERLILHNI